MFKLKVTENNRCPFDVYAYQEILNECPQGGPPEYLCYVYQEVEFPYVFSSNTVTNFSLLTVPSVNIKMSKVKDIEHGIFQFEYTLSNTTLFWDISDIDGTGDGVVGNIFADQNVQVTPTGDLGSGNCHQVTCTKGTPCKGAYQQSDDSSDTQVY